jgi:hypothetical protein
VLLEVGLKASLAGFDVDALGIWHSRYCRRLFGTGFARFLTSKREREREKVIVDVEGRRRFKMSKEGFLMISVTNFDTLPVLSSLLSKQTLSFT